jgi:hypothetical protein
MADDKRNTANERRRRPAPTIDLSATEVKSDEPSPSPTEATQGVPPRSSSEPPQQNVPPQVDNPRRGKQPIVLAAVAGLVVGAGAVAGALWLSGGMPNSDQRADSLTPRIAALEAQVKAPARPAADPLIAELNARVAKLEGIMPQPGVPDTAVDARLTTIEDAMKALGVTLAALNRRAENTAAALTEMRNRADTAIKTSEALQNKLDAIERSAKATQDKVAETGGADVVARRALAAVALRDAVVRGTPYAAELAVAKQLGADAQALAVLEPFAGSGVPTEAALSHELHDLLPAMIDATGANAAHAEGFLDRLQANARKLVRVQPVGEPAGGDPSAVMARIEVKAARNDLAGVEREIGSLPPKASVLAQAWSKKFAARQTALSAARKIAADSAAALGPR